MNPVCKKTAVAVVLFCTFYHLSNAQYNLSRYEVGVSIGTLVYQGDLSAGRLGNYQLLKPVASVSISRSFDQYFALRANLSIGGIAADESLQQTPEYKQHRNFKFSTPVAELSAFLVWTPGGQNTESAFSYYFLGGVGASFLSVTKDFSQLDLTYFDEKHPARAGLPLDIAHGTPRVIAVLPLGAGLRYAINGNWSVNTEFIYRLTATDYLDGFKYAVNPDKKDGYYSMMAGISYRFGGNRFGCPKVQ